MCLDPRHLSADQGASPAQWQFYGPKTWPGRQPCIAARDDGMGVDPRLPLKSMSLPQGRRCSSTSVLPSTGISTFLPPKATRITDSGPRTDPAVSKLRKKPRSGETGWLPWAQSRLTGGFMSTSRPTTGRRQQDVFHMVR